MTHIIRPTRNLIKPLISPSFLASTSRSVFTYQQPLASIPPTKVSSVPTGLRIATESHNAMHATVGVWIHAGSRFEHSDNRGASRFLQKMTLKGTKKRSLRQLQMDLDNCGVEFKADTCREQMYFYSTGCLSEDVPKVVELLADILQNSTLSEDDFLKERAAQQKKLELLQNDLEFLAFDYLHMTAFQGTPISQGTFGPTKTMKEMVRQDIVDLAHKFYRPSQMILVGHGAVDHQQLVDLAQEHFIEPEPLSLEMPPHVASRYIGSEFRERDDDKEMCHVAFAVEGPSLKDVDLIPMLIANNLLGSWSHLEPHGKHSRSKAIKDMIANNRGILYKPFVIPYSDIGLWGSYFVGDRMHLNEISYALQNEWLNICTNITDFRAEGAKNRLRANMLHSMDTPAGICQDIASQLMFKGHRTSLQEIDAEIADTSAGMVQEICHEWVYDKCPAIAAIGPTEAWPQYQLLRMGMTYPIL